jgi:hypothetical protein
MSDKQRERGQYLKVIDRRMHERAKMDWVGECQWQCVLGVNLISHFSSLPLPSFQHQIIQIMRIALLSVCVLACVLFAHATTLRESVEAEILDESLDLNFESLESQVFDEALALDQLDASRFSLKDLSRNPLRQAPASASAATPKFSVAPKSVVANGASSTHLSPRLSKFAAQAAAVAKAAVPKAKQMVAAAKKQVAAAKTQVKKQVAAAKKQVAAARPLVKKAAASLKASAAKTKTDTVSRRTLKKMTAAARKQQLAQSRAAAKKRVALKLAGARALVKRRPVVKVLAKAVPFKRAMVSTVAVRTAAGVAGPWGSVGNEENLALAQIARRMYVDSYRNGATIQVSYKGQCVPATILEVVTEKAFVSWLMHVPAMKALVISFRGTVNQANMESDLDFVKVPCSLGGSPCGSVHQGFLKLWLSHRDAMVRSISKFAAQHNTPLILLTGHSLGAAVAQLAALDLSITFSAKQHIVSHVHVTSLGTPRTGDAAFSTAFNKKRPTPISIARYAQVSKVLGITVNDPVSRLPLKGMGFQHIGGDETTINVQCTTCKGGLMLVKDLHTVNKYVASIAAKFGGLKVQACGSAAPFASK